MTTGAAMRMTPAAGGAPRTTGSRPVLSPWAWAALVLIAASVVTLFWPWFRVQHKLSWAYKEDWGHAYLIPLISGWMLWQRRDAIAAAAKRVFWPGLVVVLFAVVGCVFFQIGFSNHMAMGFCLVLMVYGLTLLLCGPEVARIAFLPIAYLALGVTISEQVMIEITFSLQLLASEGSWILLSLIGAAAGFSVEIDGNTLTVITDQNGSIQEFPLNVAEACSGMRMVVAFYALAFAVALVACRRWWQRIATVLLAGPIAILMNIVRVTVLGLVTLVDPNLAAGDAHTVIGMILLVPSMLLFLGAVWVLNRIESAPPDAKVTAPPTWAWASGSATRALATVIAVAAVGGSAAGFAAVKSAMGVHLEKLPIYPRGGRLVKQIPTETTGWRQIGADRVEDAEIVKSLGTENYVSRVYERRGGDGSGEAERLEFHAAYYTETIDTVPHVPERCFVGGGMQKGSELRVMPVPMATSGWEIDRLVPQEFAGSQGVMYSVRPERAYSDYLAAGGVRLPRDVGPESPFRMSVSEFLLPGGERLYAGYFFIANGGTVPRAEDVRLLAFDLRSDYAYYMKVQVTGAGFDSAEAFVASAGDLLGGLIAEIMRCVPDWIEVETGEYPPGNPRGAGDGSKGSGGNAAMAPRGDCGGLTWPLA